MAKGFKNIQSNKKFKTNNTLFERVSNATNGEKKSFSWYRSTIKSIVNDNYKTNIEPYIDDERSADHDENMIVNFPKKGHLYMYEYKAKMKWLPYYDTFPLVYVIKSTKTEFFGANLHYIPPRRRIQIVEKLLQNRIDIPKICFHKYIHNHVDGLMLDLSENEWETAILLPTENFVRDIRGKKFPYDKELVWEESSLTYYDRIKAKRIVE